METKIITLPKFEDPRGNLSFVEEENHIPFEIERTYWIYDVPGGQVRGDYAFKEQRELIGNMYLVVQKSQPVIVK